MFQAGHGKLGGRKKGTPNVKTREIQDALTELFIGQGEKLQEALAYLYDNDKKAYVEAVVKIAPYVVPRKLEIGEGNDKEEPLIIEWNSSPEAQETPEVKLISNAEDSTVRETEDRPPGS